MQTYQEAMKQIKENRTSAEDFHSDAFRPTSQTLNQVFELVGYLVVKNGKFGEYVLLQAVLEGKKLNITAGSPVLREQAVKLHKNNMLPVMVTIVKKISEAGKEYYTFE